MWKRRKSSINRVSHDAPTVSARFVYGSTTTHAGSATINPGGATNAQECSRCSHDSIRCYHGSAAAASRSPTNVHDLAVVMRQVNRDVSDTPILPDSPRTHKNGHDSTHGATKIEPDSTTVDLRFRPRPQSTTIHPECFTRFKIVVALSWRFPNRQDSSRINTVLVRLIPMSLRFYYESCRCIPI